jgi:hypothetical protein
MAMPQRSICANAGVDYAEYVRAEGNNAAEEHMQFFDEKDQ